MKFTEDQNLAYFDFWMKNKAQNEVFNLNQLVGNVFLPPQSGWGGDPLRRKYLGIAYVVEIPKQRIFQDDQQNNSLERNWRCG